jgi:predicted lipoprotein with Yx(FWY)xxD motif
MRFPRLVALGAFGAIALAACGSGGSYSSSSSTPKSVSAAPIASASSAAAATGHSSLGDVLVDAKGMTLYGLTKDINGMPTCVGACANAWPPLTVNGSTIPAGLDAKTFSVVARPDGTHQLEAGKWPLYRFAGDAAPGDTNGQGSAGFFVVTPTGALHKS